MELTLFEKIALCVSGVTALGIGGYILNAPHTFYASYGIALRADPNLLSELRAPAASLAALGAIMLVGILRATFSQIAIVAALTVYIAFPAGRIVGLVVDGMPGGNILGALAIELAIAGLCLSAFHRRLGRAPSGNAVSNLSPS